MNKPHPQAEFIKAKADGAVVQYRYLGEGHRWDDMDYDDWEFPSEMEYRIKPVSKIPETTMSACKLLNAAIYGMAEANAIAIANAALEHALATGQVVLP